MAHAWIFTCNHALAPLLHSSPPSQKRFSNELCSDCKESHQRVPGAMELAHKHRMETINLNAQREIFLLRSLAALTQPLPDSSVVQSSRQIQDQTRALNQYSQTYNNQALAELSACQQQLITLLTNGQPINKQQHYANLRNAVIEAIKTAKQNIDILKATNEFVRRQHSVNTREERAYGD